MNRQFTKAKHTRSSGKMYFGNIHLFDERRRAQHAAHGAAGAFIEKVEQQLADDQIYGKVFDAAAAHVQKAWKTPPP